MDITLVIPVYNELDNLPALFERTEKIIRDMGVKAEWMFVHDGGNDGSLEWIRAQALMDDRVHYIDFSRNFGHQVAVSAGLDHASGEYIVIMDADLQDPPELIPGLYLMAQKGYEVVYARRRQRKGEHFLKRWTAGLFYRILRKITSVDIPLDTGDFRIMHRKVTEVLKQMPERHKFLRGQIAWAGYRQTYVEYDRDERHGGKSGYTWGKMIRFALDGITAFSDFPLRLVTYFGFIVSFIAFLVGLYALYARFVSGDYVQGWASVIISVLFLGGIQMIAIGIIGEYISRMQSDIRKRPLYVVNEHNLTSISTQNDNL